MRNMIVLDEELGRVGEEWRHPILIEIAVERGKLEADL